MSLTTKALDRLVSKVITRIADGVTAGRDFPIHPKDAAAALDRAAALRIDEALMGFWSGKGEFDRGDLALEARHALAKRLDVTLDATLAKAMDAAAKERLGKILDGGGFDHRINDTIDCEVEKRLRTVDLEDLAKDRLDSIVEDRIDSSGFDRQLSRAVEDLNLDEMAGQKLDDYVDWEATARDAIMDRISNEVDLGELVRGYLDAHETIPVALAKRYACTTVQAAERAAAEVISTAICRLEDAVNTKLEAEVPPEVVL